MRETDESGRISGSSQLRSTELPKSLLSKPLARDHQTSRPNNFRLFVEIADLFVHENIDFVQTGPTQHGFETKKAKGMEEFHMVKPETVKRM